MTELLTGTNLSALMTLPGVGEKRAVSLATTFKDWATLLNATPDALVAAVGTKTGQVLVDHLGDQPLASHLPPGVHVASIHDDTYPALLRTIPDPPTLLWWTGTLPDLNLPRLAIVGTRNPDPAGQAIAALAATRAARAGIATVSGLALGVDSAASAACLTAGMPSWVVVGQGVDTLPTRGDRAVLANRILAEGGGILSEVPPGVPVARHLLTRRNRIQSGLSRATFIAQTGMPSETKPAGTIHTVRFTLEQDRLLAVAVPPHGTTDAPAWEGNHLLTRPEGIDPSRLFITDSTLSVRVAHRHPVADLPISHPDGLDELNARILNTP